MKLANVLYIFPVKRNFQQTKLGIFESWYNRVVSFFFSEVKASKTRQHTLTNIRAKNIIQTEENQMPSNHWFTVFLLTKAEPRYLSNGSVLLTCLNTYLVCITVLSQLPLQTHLFSVTNEGTK